MEVRIINKFHDKADFTKVYLVGETVTFDDDRAHYLISLGLVESAEPVAEPEVEPEVAPEVEPVVEEQETEESEPVSKKRVTKKDN